MSYIKIFHASDDTEVSGSGVYTNDVEFTLNALLEETDEERLYLLAESGYVVSGVVVTPTGTKSAKWALALDDGGSPGDYEDYGNPLEVGEVGDTTKVFFWAKARATSDEGASKDVSVTLHADGTAQAE